MFHLFLFVSLFVTQSEVRLIDHHGDISVQKLPQICTLHIVKMGKSGIDIEMIKSDIFKIFSLKSYAVDSY